MSGIPYVPFTGLPWVPPHIGSGRDKHVGRAEGFEPGWLATASRGAAGVLLGDEASQVCSWPGVDAPQRWGKGADSRSLRGGEPQGCLGDKEAVVGNSAGASRNLQNWDPEWAQC